MPNLFPISLEVEEVAVGHVLRKLTSMQGVARVHLNLQNVAKQLASPVEPEKEESKEVIDNRPEYPYRDGRGNPRKGRPINNEMYKAVADVLLKTPAHYHLLAAAMERAGYSPHGIHGLMYRMKKMKWIVRTSPGTYRITPKGEKVFKHGAQGEIEKRVLVPRISTNQPSFTGHRKGNNKAVNNYAGVRWMILNALGDAQGNSLTRVDMAKAMVEAGFSTTNLWNAGVKLAQEGLIDYKNERYVMTAAGRRVYDNKPEESTQHKTSTNKEGLEANG